MPDKPTCYIDGCDRPRASKKQDLLCHAHKKRLIEHRAVLGDIPIGEVRSTPLRRIAYERRVASPEGQGLQPLNAPPLLDGGELVYTDTGPAEGIYAAGDADHFWWGVWSGTAASKPRLIGPFARFHEAREFLRQRKGGRASPTLYEPVEARLPRYHPDVAHSLLGRGVYFDPDTPGVYVAVMEGLLDWYGRRPRAAIATNDREHAERIASSAPEVLEDVVSAVRERDALVARYEIARRITREDELDAYRREFGKAHPAEERGEAMPREDVQAVVNAFMARRRIEHAET
jgi:hypothetical protein